MLAGADEDYETIENQEPESEPSTESQKQGESDGPLIGIPTPELTPEPSTLPFPPPSEPIHQQDETGTVEEELNEPTTENRSKITSPWMTSQFVRSLGGKAGRGRDRLEKLKMPRTDHDHLSVH